MVVKQVIKSHVIGVSYLRRRGSTSVRPMRAVLQSTFNQHHQLRHVLSQVRKRIGNKLRVVLQSTLHQLYWATFDETVDVELRYTPERGVQTRVHR